MTILPNQIPPPGMAMVGKDGIPEQNWWLYFYNIGQHAIGNDNTSSAPYAAQLVLDTDIDAATIDQLQDRVAIAGLQKTPPEDWIGPSIADVQNALLLAQGQSLPDPPARAQPVTVLTPGASPWVYQAMADGTLVLVGGTVSSVGLSRDGATFYTVPQGATPMSRLDSVKTTYTVAPTSAVFFPR